MSVDHLDILHGQIPELFQPRDLSPVWDDDLIIVPIEDPEWHFEDTGAQIASRSEGQRVPSYFDLERIGLDVELSDLAAPTFSPVIIETLGGAHAGTPVPRTDLTRMPPSDCLAFYLPFHYYHPTWWGVYLLLEGVLWLANEILRRSRGMVSRLDAIQASRLFLYYHEAFHHKTECFATRLELTHRKPFFKTGFERLYQKTIGTIDCLEEGLANASALTDTHKALKMATIRRALEGYVKDSPPGYDQGVIIRKKWMRVRCRFAEENQHSCLPHLPTKNPEVWQTTPHMFDGISSIKSRVNYVIPRNSPLVARLPFRPLLPPSKLVRKLKELAKIEFVRNGGDHDIYRTPKGNTVPIPRHPRDLDRGLLRKILREAGLDMGLEEFLQ